MRRRFGQALRLGVSSHAVALVKTSRWNGAPVQVLAELLIDPDAPDGLMNGLRDLLSDSGCARWPVTIVLSDELVRLWQVSPPPGATRLADLEGAAALRFQNLYGDSIAAWQTSAAWDPLHPFMAAAAPRSLVAQLQQAGAEQQLTIVEMAPQFIVAWNRWRGAVKPDSWYALVHGQVLTLGAVEQGTLHAVRAAPLPEDATLDWLARHVAREALRLNLTRPEQLQVSGPAPAAWGASKHARLACTLLVAEQEPAWSETVRLAVTGSRS